MRWRSLAFQIPAVVVAAMLAQTSFDEWGQRRALLRRLERDALEALTSSARSTAELLSAAEPALDEARARAAVERVAELRLADRVSLIDDAGRIVASATAAAAHSPALAATDPSIVALARIADVAARRTPRALGREGLVSVIAPLVSDYRGGRAWLMLETDVAPRVRRLDAEILRQLLTTALTALALAAVLVFWLRRRVSAPAARLGDAAAQVSAGAAGASVGLRGDDELGRAGRAFDVMARQVRERATALESAHRTLDAMIAALPVGVLAVDRASERVLFMNPRWSELYGVEVHVGDTLDDIHSLANVERLDGARYPKDALTLRRVLRTGSAARADDIVYVHPDGTRVPVLVEATPVHIAGGPEFDAIVLIAQDRREITRAHDELAANERRYAQVTRAAGQVIYDWDIAARVVKRSGDYAGLLGWAPSDASDFEDLHAHIHPDDVERVRRRFQALIDDDAPYDEEFRFRREPGRWIAVRDQAFVQRDAQRRPVRVFGLISDVTQRRELEDQLRQAQKMETVGTLAGGVAHDFNNQLTAVFGHLDLLESELAPDDKRREHLRIARVAASRCAELTRGLLAFGRRITSRPRPIEVGQLVEESLQLIGRALSASIRVETSFEPGLPETDLDPVQIQQVLFNIVLNARDAMPRGGTLRVWTRAATSEEGLRDPHGRAAGCPRVVIGLEDDGMGMSPEVKERIFEPFFTTKPPGSGTGLGLSMAYGIVTHHQGWIEVESEPGAGAMFRIFLPARDPAHRDRPPARSATAATPRARVLVVDDEPVVREFAAQALRISGYETVTADDGEAAIEILRSGPVPELVLLDLVMPGKRGLDVLRELRTIAPEVRCLLMSGYAPGAEIAAAAADGFLAKPFTSQELTRAVEAALATIARAALD